MDSTEAAKMYQLENINRAQAAALQAILKRAQRSASNSLVARDIEDLVRGCLRAVKKLNEAK